MKCPNSPGKKNHFLPWQAVHPWTASRSRTGGRGLLSPGPHTEGSPALELRTGGSHATPAPRHPSPRTADLRCPGSPARPGSLQEPAAQQSRGLGAGGRTPEGGPGTSERSDRTPCSPPPSGARGPPAAQSHEQHGWREFGEAADTQQLRPRTPKSSSSPPQRPGSAARPRPLGLTRQPGWCPRVRRICDRPATFPT